MLDAVPEGTKLIGVFGFLGRYKGFDTVVRALHHLPEDYHLLIFGGVHPNEIKPHQPIDPVVSSLFDAGYVDTSVAERIRANSGTAAPAVSVAVDGSMRDLLIEHPKDLSGRIHFLGAQSDADFLAGMVICDAVVFPYLEVGQSSSGPISQALELGCRVIASRTHTFLQLGRYHHGMIEFFDIGNHLELAGRIRARRQFERGPHLPAFSVETNKSIYLAANGGTPKAEPPAVNSRVRVRDFRKAASGYKANPIERSLSGPKCHPALLFYPPSDARLLLTPAGDHKRPGGEHILATNAVVDPIIFNRLASFRRSRDAVNRTRKSVWRTTERRKAA